MAAVYLRKQTGVNDTIKYAAQQLPVLYEPLAATTYEYAKSLKSVKVRGVSGFVANPMGVFMPEYFHY